MLGGGVINLTSLKAVSRPSMLSFLDSRWFSLLVYKNKFDLLMAASVSLSVVSSALGGSFLPPIASAKFGSISTFVWAILMREDSISYGDGLESGFIDAF